MTVREDLIDIFQTEPMATQFFQNIGSPTCLKAGNRYKNVLQKGRIDGNTVFDPTITDYLLAQLVSAQVNTGSFWFTKSESVSTKVLVKNPRDQVTESPYPPSIDLGDTNALVSLNGYFFLCVYPDSGLAEIRRPLTLVEEEKITDLLKSRLPNFPLTNRTRSLTFFESVRRFF